MSKNNKQKKDGIQIGNYLVTREGLGEMKYLKVQAVSGIWNTKWRSDNEFYHFVEPLINDPDRKAYLESFFTICYLMCNGFKDLEFMQGFKTIFLAQVERIGKIVGNNPLSDEEDREIIDEEKKAYEVLHGKGSLDKPIEN